MCNLDKTLDGPTGALFLEFVQACAQGCSDTEAFRTLVRRYVKQLLPHRFSIAVLGGLSLDQLVIKHMVGVDYPDVFLAAIPRQLNIRERPVVARWLACRQAIVIDPVRDAKHLSQLELREISAFGLGRLAIHGQVDLSSHMGSYFSFAGTEGAATDARLKFMLQIIAPHLHAALTSLPTLRMTVPAMDCLTALEHELLLWLAAGRSNAEIGKLRGRSSATVRNQLHALYRKLSVRTRSEAVGMVSQGRILVSQRRQ